MILQLSIFIPHSKIILTRRCKYCQQFTPKFEKVAKNDRVHGVVYGKIDGPAYKNVT